MSYKYLPLNKTKKMYSPKGVQRLFKEAVLEENGNIQAVFDKGNKYKSLLELWYAAPLAVAIYKELKYKFYLYSGDSPDIHLVTKDEKTKQPLEGFSVEIMTLFNYPEQVFDGNYAALAKNIWTKKGEKAYDESVLLLVSRLNGVFNVNVFANEISKFDWMFPKIWLSIFTEKNNTWSLFEIFPLKKSPAIGSLRVGLSELPY